MFYVNIMEVNYIFFLMKVKHMILKIIFFKSLNTETSLAIQRLRLCLPLQGLWVLSLAGELKILYALQQKTKA